jgi:2-succinyl-5-enolpyruvyl-6-hydroxy-3-cyclohexene-1-carboxylate synthase
MHLDERSAGFFGLGMAKVKREAVALVCTSGTAAANFLPAVVEAYYGRVPLVILTADRPHELRDCGAPQTIDQLHLYGRHAKWFFDMAEPDCSPELVRHVREVAFRAVVMAQQSPAGPVHINCPYREPLVLDPAEGPIAPSQWSDRAHRVSTPGTYTINNEQAATLAGRLTLANRGLIVCGPQDDPRLAASVTMLATKLGYPVLADPLSGVRCGGHDRGLVLDCYDAFLRHADFAAQFTPEVVIRFGAPATSKTLQLYLQLKDAAVPVPEHIVVDDGGLNAPAGMASQMIRANGREVCEALISVLPAALGERVERVQWVAAWRAANTAAREAITTQLSGTEEMFEGKVFAELGPLLPSHGATVFVGNSMPVRDLDTFFPGGDQVVHFLANRGVNGIDGVVSSALGASVNSERPLVLVIGDLSFCHDLSALLAAKQHGLSATIILLNNRGGGIFSFLPQAADPEHFETVFGCPHDLDFRAIVEACGVRYTRVTTWQGFRSAVRKAIATDALDVIEVPTERGRNVELHRDLWQAVALRVTDVAKTATS